MDVFDRRYYHLILWNDAAHEITGGYRLGMVPELLRVDGDKGLYTSRLFRFAPAFWERYGQSLELGRAVVRPERQRDFLPLLLLWKGIARFVLRHPSIRYLFGPVSMNLDASPFTLRLLGAYFMGRHGDGELEWLVRARVPFRRTRGAMRLLRASSTPCGRACLTTAGLIASSARRRKEGAFPSFSSTTSRWEAALRRCTGMRDSVLWTPFCSWICPMPRKRCCAVIWAGKTLRLTWRIIFLRRGRSRRRTPPIVERFFSLPAFPRPMIALVPALFYLIRIT